MAHFLFRLGHQHRFRFFRRQLRDTLQLRLLLFVHLGGAAALLLQRRVLRDQSLFFLFQRFQLAVEILFLLLKAAFLTRHIRFAFFRILVKALPHLVDFFLRLEHGLLLSGLARRLCFLHDAPCLFLGGADCSLRLLLSYIITAAGADNQSQRGRQNQFNDTMRLPFVKNFLLPFGF